MKNKNQLILNQFFSPNILQWWHARMDIVHFQWQETQIIHIGRIIWKWMIIIIIIGADT